MNRALVIFLTGLTGGGVAAAPPRTPTEVTTSSLEASRPVSMPLLRDMTSVKALRAALHQLEAARPPGHEEKRTEEGVMLEEEGLDLLESSLSHLDPRAFPEDRVDWDAIARAARRDPPLPPAAWNAADGRPARWEFVGPQDLPVPYRQYFGQGAINGRVNAVAFDPTDAATWYLGAAGGGVWRTRDSGRTWTPLTDDWPLLTVSALAVIATPGGPTVIAGTGDFPYPAIAPGLGLRVSRDGGKTWGSLGPPRLASFAISSILVDPDDPRRLTVSCGRGTLQWGAVWQSRDGGLTWGEVIAHPAAWCRLSAGPADATGQRWYWAVGYDEAGHRLVYRSVDRGTTWTEVLRAGPLGFMHLCDIAASRIDPRTAYVLLGGLRRIMVTRDGGTSFQDVTGDFPAGPGGYNWSQDWYDLWLGTSSFRQEEGPARDLILVGLIDVAGSLGGEKWWSLGRTYTPLSLTHNDQQGHAVDPRDPGHILLASDGGVYSMRVSPGKGTATFTSHNAKLGASQFYRAAFDATRPDVMLAGTQDNGTPQRSASGAAWRNISGGDGAYCAIDWKRPATQYSSSQFLWIYRTTDDWKTSRVLGSNWGSDRRAFIAPFILDPTDPGRLYAGTNHLWRWEEKSGKWEPRLGGQKLSEQGELMSIAVAPTDARRLYTGSSRGEVWTSGDAGATWSRIDRGSPDLPARAVTSLAVSPLRPTEVIVGLSGTGAPHVWRCPDVSQVDRVWQDRSGSPEARLPDAPLDCIVIDPAHPDQWFVATDVGVFHTGDAGARWTDATGPLGLPGVHVNDLAVVRATGYLDAATFGRGLWRIPLPAE